MELIQFRKILATMLPEEYHERVEALCIQAEKEAIQEFLMEFVKLTKASEAVNLLEEKIALWIPDALLDKLGGKDDEGGTENSHL